MSSQTNGGRKMRARLILGLLAGLSSPTWADPCFDTYKLSDQERAVEPGEVISAAGDVPEHCAVRGVINRAIRFEVRMPLVNWNGRFLMMGTGGSSGYIADTTRDLHRGYAISSTDTGHEQADLDFPLQPEAALDYAFRGVHLAAQTSKDVIQAYYAKDIGFSYYQGCSNGGRQGLMEATRYPTDFDGIVAGAPAFQPIREFTMWSMHVNRAQEKHPITEAHLALLDQRSRSACDSLDGIEDGVINDPRECTLERLSLTELKCKTGQSPEMCLTEGQLKTVMAHYQGLVDTDGSVVAPGLMPGAEGAGDWTVWGLPATVPGFQDKIVLNRLTT